MAAPAFWWCSIPWDSTRSIAQLINARFVVFQTPSTFYPDANHLRDMYRFFKGIRRDKLSLVWQPAGHWETRMVKKVCADLNLVRAVNPLEEAEVPLHAGRDHARNEL